MRCWKAKACATGLLVTEGFRAVYPVGEQARPYGAAIFDVMYDKPSLLVTPSATGEVKERVDFRGNVLRELDEAALRQTLRRLKEQKVEFHRRLPAVFISASATRTARGARSSARRYRTARFRFRRKFCRRSANITG